MYYQVVFIIHGVGDQDKGYSMPFQKKLKKFIKSYSNVPNTNIKTILKEIRWSPITQKIQDKLAKRFSKQKLGFKTFRKIMLNLIGDALAYQDSDRGDEVYKDIHASIDKARADVDKIVGNNPVEYTIVAHSLGSVIASDYCYDNTHSFKLTNFFTMGSPIALWTMRAGDPKNADTPVQVDDTNGAWINIFDDDDIIGWPLRVINKHYRKAVDFDYNTEIGGFLDREHPLSHRGYWKDGNAVKPIAKKIALDQERLIRGWRYKRGEYLDFIKSLWNI